MTQAFKSTANYSGPIACMVMLPMLVFLTRTASGAPAYHGVSYTPFGENVLLTRGSDQSIANMAAIGVDMVALNVWSFQDNQNSTDIELDFSRYSASIASIEHAIEEIHSRGMGVLLKPMVDLRNGGWRGEINPSPAWFAEYSSYINEWATFAESHGVELFSVGCEFNRTDSSEASWRNVVAGVRQRYTGPITYSATFDSYQTVHWWDALDYVGIDAYFGLANNNNATLGQITQATQNVANGIESWRNSQGLSQRVIFTEFGVRSADGAATRPWYWEDLGNGVVDLQEQANVYQAMLTAHSAKSWWDGAFWWNWETNPYAGGVDDGYTPQNKPAEEILRAYYGGTGPRAPVGVQSQRLFSWEDGAQGWRVSPLSTHPTTVQQSGEGQTEGQFGLAVTQTGNGFNWNAFVSLQGDALFAMIGAVKDDPADYRLEFDVTYDTDHIPQGSVSWMNGSVAINGRGGWSQVDGVGTTDGRTNETIRVSILLSAWSTLPSDHPYPTFDVYLGVNGDWGPGAATVFYDNFRIVNVSAPLPGDYDGNGVVDAADYTVWRDSLGQQGKGLAADGNLNRQDDVDDYNVWKSHFGETAGVGTGSHVNVAVPEPAATMLLIGGMLAMCCRRQAVLSQVRSAREPANVAGRFTWFAADQPIS